MNNRRVGLLLCVLLALGSAWYFRRDANWERFHQERVKRYFTLPAEVRAVDWHYSQSFPMGEDLRVRFRLPASKAPEQWLNLIAKESAMGGTRKDPYHFIADDRQLRYNSSTGIYDVFYSF